MLKPLRCPSCGAVIDNFDELTQSAVCPYCGTTLQNVPDLQARYEVDVKVADVATPASLSRRGFELMRLGEYAEAGQDFERAMEVDDGCFLAYYGKALLVNIGGNDDATVRFYLEKAAKLYPASSGEDRQAARAAAPYACIDEGSAGAEPLLARLPRLNLPEAEAMLLGLGADQDRLSEYQTRVAAEARKAKRAKVLAAVVPFALVLLFFALLLSDWVDAGFKGFMIISAVIILIIIGAVGNKG